MLLVGLLTRTALEGYLTGGWRGTDAVDGLLTVGLGMVEPPVAENEKDGTSIDNHVNDNSEVGDEFEWFDPDGFPSLREAAKIMFPGLQASKQVNHQRREGTEADFEQELNERLRRVSLCIPQLTAVDYYTHSETS